MYTYINKGGYKMPYVKKKCTKIKEDEEKVIEIARNYDIAFQNLIVEGKTDVGKLCLFDSKCNETSGRDHLFEGKFTIGNSESYRKILSVNMALLNIGKDEALILYNDYFFPCEKKWWVGKYSCSAYYRLKKRAIEKFLYVVSQ